MTDPATVAGELHDDLIGLDKIGKQLHNAVAELDQAEDEWEVLLDQVGEDLKDEYARSERRTDPAEHTIRSVARKQNRAEYRRYRQAKRRVDLLEKQLQKQRALTNGRQSELGYLRDEVKVPVPESSRQPQTFGGRRAA